METEHIFGKSLFGFNREEVVEYIEQLMREITAARSECAELRNVIGSYEKAAEEQESIISSLRQQVAELEEKLASPQTESEDEEEPLSTDDLTPDDISRQANDLFDGLDAILKTYLGGGASNG